MTRKRSIIAILACLFLGFLALVLYIANEVPRITDARISRSIRKEFLDMARTNGFSFSSNAVKSWSPLRNSTTLVLYDQLDSNQRQIVKSVAEELSKLYGRRVDVEFKSYSYLKPPITNAVERP
jgi:hypothetical protein